MIESAAEALAAIDKQLVPEMNTQAVRLLKIQSWSGPAEYQGGGVLPQHTTAEYDDLMEEAKTPYGLLVVNAHVPGLRVAGYSADTAETAMNDPAEDVSPTGWRVWQANDMDAVQVSLMSDVVRYGYAYTFTEMGADPLTGDPMPVVRTTTPLRGVALYQDQGDTWPEVAMRVSEYGREVRYTVYSGSRRWVFQTNNRAKDSLRTAVESSPSLMWPGPDGVSLVGEYDDGGPDVTPVMAFRYAVDSDYRVRGAIEPLIPLLKRLDQVVCDRLIAQRFTAWVVRTVTGIALYTEIDEDGKTDEEIAAERRALRLRLKQDSLLAAENPDAKFGSLGVTPLDPFISAEQQDQDTLLSVAQLPPSYLLRGMKNLSAEALTASELSSRTLMEMVREFVGAAHEANMRLWAAMLGDVDGARDMESQVRWASNSSQSLGMVVDAMTKLAPEGGLSVSRKVLLRQLGFLSPRDIEESTRELQNSQGIDALVKALSSSASASDVQVSEQDGQASGQDGQVSDGEGA